MIKKTCVILGEGPLPIQCMDILRDKGFQILSFISRDEELLNQSSRYTFPFHRFPSQLDETVQPDYIFSINNGIILKPEFIARAKSLVINYHDSPLPKYAGMYAPNWALMNHETQHAVSWHILNEGIDTGDILEQEFIEISDMEPIWSVNMKCFEAALLSFERLAGKIVAGAVTQTPQDLSTRSYFPLMARPYHLGLVTAERTIKELETLQQACNYGNDNEFLLPHLYIGAEYFTLSTFRMEAGTVSSPGTIVLEENKAGFQCMDGLVVLEQLYDKNNKRVEFIEILHKYNLSAGQMLTLPENSTRIESLFSELCKSELFWVQELSKVEILPFPYTKNVIGQAERMQVTSALHFTSLLEKRFPNEDSAMVMLALTAAFILRINDQEAGTVGYIPAGLPQVLAGYSSLFKTELPLNLKIPEGMKASKMVEGTLQHLKKMAKSGSYTVDLPLRYKALVAEDAALVLCTSLPVVEELNERSLYLAVEPDRIILSIPGSGFEWGARCFTESLQAFIHSFLETPDGLLQDLSLMETEQTKTMLASLNRPSGTAFPIPGILAQFDRMVALHGDKPALMDGQESHSYRQFQRDTMKLATQLLEKGVKPNDIVMLCLPRSYPFFVAQWAALRCRAAFLPIDSTMPDDRKTFILEDSQAVLVITNESFSEVFPKDKTYFFKEIPNLKEASELFAEPTDLAYLIYTSGSTGVPKGVRISHQALTTFVSAGIGTYGFTDSERVLQFSNLGFDASVEEVFCTLCAGGTLYIRTEEMLDPEVLIQYSIRNDITIWDFPTAFWRQVLAASADGTFPSAIRAVIIGGEAITNSDFENWKQHPSSKRRLFNTYGPTETTVVATVFELTPDFEMETNIPIGNPLPGYRTYITDKHRNLLPVGLPGELLIAGPALADGYLNRDDVEKKVFIRLEVPGLTERCYCTGDQVFSDVTGKIHYIGRADGQLKIRGFRVEPGEIENQIMQLGGIKQCVVLGKANEKGEKHLVCYIKSSVKDRGESLKAECLRILPNYMVPEQFIEVAEIPMTPNGKIDQKFLLARSAPVRKKVSYVTENEQTTPLQETLIRIWQDVLEDKTLSLDDDFFENGGHSLRAVRLMATLKKELEVHLPLSSLISYPTPRAMAELMESSKTENLWKCLVPIRPKGSKMPLYLIHGAGLNVLLYQSLGNHLDPDRPIYAMQAKGLDGTSQISTSIEEMANDYVTEIRKNQPEGPYAIFGFSLGGFIAFEMARQLLEQGQKVAFLGVIDTVTTFANEPRSFFNKLTHRLKALFGKPAFFLYALLRESKEGKVKFLRQKAKNIRGTLYYYASRFGLIKTLDTPSASTNEQPVYLSTKASVIIDTALNRYVLKPAPVTVDLFRAGKQMFYIEEPKTYGWSKYAQNGVVIENVPGEHSELFAAPNDAIFAKLLTDRLNEIENRR